MGLIHWGSRRCCPVHTWERHANNNFINEFFAQIQLVQSGLERCPLTQLNVWKKSKLVPARYCHIARGCCTWHVFSVFCMMHPNDWIDWGRKDTVRLGQTMGRPWQVSQLNCRGIVGSNPDEVGKTKYLRCFHKAMRYTLQPSS